jgi:hypothetical protein
MATGTEVLTMLIPNGGWIISGDQYEGITFLECDPITEKQFSDGFNSYAGWKAQQDAAEAAAKSEAEAKLGALGLTPEDLKALGL